MTIDAQALAERYVALWNETDAAARRAAIEALWRPDGEHFVRTLAARGYAELDARVTGSHDKNVGVAGYRFRAVADAQALRDAVSFHWEMIRPQDDEVLATGLQFLVLDADGRIATDYQFIVS
jgi:hypothetical protein